MRKCFTKGLCILMSMIICVSFTIGGNTLAVAESTSGDASSEASSNTAPIAEYNDNNVYTFKDKDAGVKVLVVKKDSWDNGYIADVSIENTGDKALANWHIDLTINGDIDSVWNSEYEVKDGKIKLSYPSWKRKIDVCETYSIGMKVNGTFGGFDDFSYYEDAKEASDLYKIEYIVRNSWDHHAVIDAVLTNIGDTTLRDWSLEMGFNADIVDIWNAGIECYENGNYLLKCKDYNADIEPNDSVVFGFQAQYEDDDIILPTDSKLVAVADSKLVPAETDKVDWYKVMTNADSDEAIRMRDNVQDRIKVAIIDSGVDYMGEGDEINRVDFIGDTEEENPLYDDRSGHGTGVAGMLLGASEEDETEEEETTEAPISDMDFSYLTDADYIEVEDADDEDSGGYDEEYDGEDYEDDDDIGVEDDVDENNDYDVEINEDFEENNVFDDEEELGDDNIDEEGDNLDNLNLFEYNELYGEIEGLNPNIELTSLRVLDEDNEAPVSRVIAAIEWAIDNDINILNLSWGIDTDNADLHNVIKRAYNKGILIIAAAGNDGEITYPAKYDEVIAVGSVDSMAKLAASSASGDMIELVAPAEDVIVYTSFGILTFASGTSYAAPQIAALASILWQQDVTVSNKCIRELLRQSASPLGDSKCYGYGMADYKKAAGMYAEFVNEYVDNSIAEDAIADSAIDEVSTIDEQYVKGLWCRHDKMITGNTDKIKAIKAGLWWPDSAESGVQGMSDNPKFHGGISRDEKTKMIIPVNNYADGVDGYLELMSMGRSIAETGSINKKVYYSDFNYTIVNKVRHALNKYVGYAKNKTNACKYISTEKSIIEATSKDAKKMKKITGYFLMGMALHSLGDMYSHQSYGLFNEYKWYYTGRNKEKKSVKFVPNSYYHIIHGSKNENIGDDAKISNALGFDVNKDKGKFFDNHADCPNVSPNRYLYAKKIYKELIEKNVDEYVADASDYYSVSNKGLTKSDKLWNRVKCIDNHFAIKDFKECVFCSVSDNADLMDLDSLYYKYKKWSVVNINIGAKLEDCEVYIYKQENFDGSTEYKKVADSNDKLTMLCSGDVKNKQSSFSFICNTDELYILVIIVKDENGIKHVTKQFRVSKDDSNEKPPKYKGGSFLVHKINSKNTYNKTLSRYEMIFSGIINVNDEFFTTATLCGDIRDIDENPIAGAEISLVGKSGNTYTSFSNKEGEYIINYNEKLYPDVYQFTVRKEGYDDVSGEVVVRSDSANWNHTIYLQKTNSLECKEVYGSIIDAETWKTVKGVQVELHEGVCTKNEIPILITSSDDSGRFTFKGIKPGMYTILVSDKRNISAQDKYIDSQTVFVAKSNQICHVDCIVSTSIDSGSIRVVLNWGNTPRDLDGHLYGTIESDDIHCYYANRDVNNDYIIASLDRDDTRGNGTETMTIKLKSMRRVKYVVHNYSKNSVDGLSNSKATVQVYFSDGKCRTIPVPKKGKGYNWDVFEYDGSSCNIVKIDKIH